MIKLPLRALRLLVATAAGASRVAGRGDGSVVGGRLALRIDQEALHRLSVGRTVVLVSGTNGKTTTTRLLSAALAVSRPVVSNVTGANLPSGMVTALALDPAPTAVLEVDERYLSLALRQTGTAVVVLLNLSRDQLDRMGEVSLLAEAWREALASSPTTVVANADDRLVSWAAEAAREVVWVRAGAPWSADATVCRSCGGVVLLPDHPPDGQRAVAAAELSCRCTPPGAAARWALEGNSLAAPGEGRYPLDLALPGRANRANAAMAAAAAQQLGVSPDSSLPCMARVGEVAGRYAVVDLEGRRARLLLAKNPAGWLEVLPALAAPPSSVVLAMNARSADGRDPSWLWDVPFEALRGRRVVVCGERRRDLAVRMHYADVACAIAPTALQALRALPPGPVDVVATYTAFQGLRRELGLGN